ncbi:urease accessory protein UreD [Amorphus orientalis]|uniref:Urease accessory protein UreD n=1 Tax=Amorphus orientalis TaxID=649198 RepID=A0AAE4AS28_9HYPH|nr:urease accessory protein UreD [Amorphus orientalis]MDQ0315776.1 urease accessory protein [Amorphus orientalis]
MTAAPPHRFATQEASRALDLTFRRQRGRTRLGEQRVRYPFHITRPFHFDTAVAPGLATLYLQSASGGYYRGERLLARVRAEPGAEVCVTTQASTIVHHARGTATVADTRIEAEAGSVVFHMPDPLILLPGADLLTTLTVRRAPDAAAVVSEAFLAHDPDGEGQPFARLDNEIRIETPDGVPEAIDRMVVDVDGLSVARRLGGTIAAGGVLIVGPQAAAADPLAVEAGLGPIDGARLAVSRLPFDCGLTVRIAAGSGRELTAALDASFAAAFRLIYGGEPARRRK